MPDSLHLTRPPTRLTLSEHGFYFDFDGTLAPIVETPAEADLSPRMRDLLGGLIAQTGGAVAVVSGRALDDLDRILAPLHLPASGSHGMELRLGGAEKAPTPPEGLLSATINRVMNFAAKQGVTAERKPGAIALHYRKTPSQAEACRAFVEALTGEDPALRALHGKMVSEVALHGIDKGHAVAQIAATRLFAGRRPIMVGDDVTDEDGFRAAQDAGGFGIKIGPGATAAAHRLSDVSALADWLEDILH